jgi:hypothetical protein
MDVFCVSALAISSSFGCGMRSVALSNSKSSVA